jgi:hypothetical protein
MAEIALLVILAFEGPPLRPQSAYDRRLVGRPLSSMP